MRSLLRISLPVVMVLLLSSLAVAGEPATPLGKWMKANVGAPLAGQDFDTLQKSLTLVASKPPSDSYPKWADFANTGAAAAGKQDLGAVKASCKRCHEAYKETYKKEFAARPFP